MDDASTSALGRRAEERACRYLTSQGLRTLNRNFRSRAGEIDLVMEDAATIVFVEVRFRGASSLVGAAESVDRRKQQRLCRAAEHYLHVRPELAERVCRFDVVAIDDHPSAGRIQWIRGAFDA